MVLLNFLLPVSQRSQETAIPLNRKQTNITTAQHVDTWSQSSWCLSYFAIFSHFHVHRYRIYFQLFDWWNRQYYIINRRRVERNSQWSGWWLVKGIGYQAVVFFPYPGYVWGHFLPKCHCQGCILQCVSQLPQLIRENVTTDWSYRTSCTKPKSMYHFNPTAAIENELSKGGLNISLSDIKYPSDIQKKSMNWTLPWMPPLSSSASVSQPPAPLYLDP